MNIGRYIKKVRKESGITQEKLAELAGLCEKTIRRIEKEQYSKETSSIRKVLNVLGIRTSNIESRDNLILNYEITENDSKEIIQELEKNNVNQNINELEKSLSGAYECFKKENYNKALELYLETSKLCKNETIYLDVANLYYNLGIYEKAIEFADIILGMKLHQYEAINIKGASLVKLKKYDEAISAFKYGLSIGQSYIDYYNLGFVYYISGNNHEAIEQYKKCLEINKEHAESHLNISICYFNTMQYELSLGHINEALRLDPKMYQAYVRKGEHYRFFEEYDKAIKYFRLCLELDSKNYQSLLGVAISLQMTDKISESVEYFKKFFELYSDNLFKDDKKTIVIVDIGYKKTHFIKIDKIDKSIYRLFIKNKHMNIDIKDDGNIIYIGCVNLSDDTATLHYPIIGKSYKNKKSYEECITNIKNSVELQQIFDEPRWIEFENKIKVEIIEQIDEVEIKIKFGDSYEILGLTDNKGEGFRRFIEKFNEYEQFIIQIEHPDDVFRIDCVNNIVINRFENK